MSNKVFLDQRVGMSYSVIIVASLPSVMSLLIAGLWKPALIFVAVLIGVLTYGLPVRAVAYEKDEVSFDSWFRSVRITKTTLLSVKLRRTPTGGRHILLRTNKATVRYRLRSYTDAAKLATIISRIIKQVPDAMVTDDVRKLLAQTAKSKAP